MVTVISVCVSPSAGEVVAEAVTVEAEADGDPARTPRWRLRCEVMLSVVSVAVKVTVSATVSVTEKDTWPFAPVTAGDGAPTTALPGTT